MVEQVGSCLKFFCLRFDIYLFHISRQTHILLTFFLGLIKAALTNPSKSKPGDFRATFEAQIKMADLVFLRTFVAVHLEKYYNPILNRLFSFNNDALQGNGIRLMRTLGELRWETGDKPEVRSDSQYKVCGHF